MASANILPPPLTSVLDQLDKKILFELDCDSFQSFSQIGEKLAIGRDVISYRVKRLENLGIIRGYIPIINYSKLGFFYSELCLKFKPIAKKTIKEIIKFYSSKDYILSIDETKESFDLSLTFLFKDFSSFGEQKQNLLKKYKKYIHNFKFLIPTKRIIFKRNYLIKKAKNKSQVILTKPKKITDISEDKIIYYVSKNARVDYISIAKQTKFSISQVQYKIKKLKEKNILLGAKPLLNLSKLGRQYYILYITLKNYSIYNKIQTYLFSNITVVEIIESSNNIDLQFSIEVKDQTEFQKFLEKLKNNFSQKIEDINYLLFTKNYKSKVYL